MTFPGTGHDSYSAYYPQTMSVRFSSPLVGMLLTSACVAGRDPLAPISRLPRLLSLAAIADREEGRTTEATTPSSQSRLSMTV